jgi:hypothetical protein
LTVEQAVPVLEEELEGKVRLMNPVLFAGFLRAVSAVTDEVPLRFDAENQVVHARALDPSEVGMIDATYSASVDKDIHDLTAVVRLRDILTAFPKRPKKDDQYETVEIDVRKGGMTVIVKESSLELGWLKPEGRPLPLPKITFTSSVPVDLRAMLEAVQSMKGLTDRVGLSFSEDHRYLLVAGEGEDIKKVARMELDSRSSANTMDSAKYDVGRLEDILRAMRPLSEWASLQFGRDSPMKLTVDLGAYPRVHIDHYLASLIES